MVDGESDGGKAFLACLVVVHLRGVALVKGDLTQTKETTRS